MIVREPSSPPPSENEQMPFTGFVVPSAVTAEAVDEALTLLGFGEDAADVTSFTFEAREGGDPDTPNSIGALTVTIYRRGAQFTATLPVVDE